MMDVLVGVLIAAGSGGLGFYLGLKYMTHRLVTEILSSIGSPK